MSYYRMVQNNNMTGKLNIATCNHGTHSGMSEWTCETNCSQNNYDNYQNVCNLVTVNRGSFEFTSSNIFKHYTYLFFNCCIVGAGNISGTQCIQPLPSCIIISVIYILNAA